MYNKNINKISDIPREEETRGIENPMYEKCNDIDYDEMFTKSKLW